MSRISGRSGITDEQMGDDLVITKTGQWVHGVSLYFCLFSCMLNTFSNEII